MIPWPRYWLVATLLVMLLPCSSPGVAWGMNALLYSGKTPYLVSFEVLQQGQGSEEANAAAGALEIAKRSPEPENGRPPYRIGVGDVILVSVLDHAQFDSKVVVRPDGKISLPLVSEIAIAGMTPVSAEQLLSERLAVFVKHPAVTVSVLEIHSRVVYISGEVLRPGAYALADTIDVVQLVSRAGGTTAYAKKDRLVVLRAGTAGTRVKVNYKKILRGQNLEDNVRLNAGDTVVVP